MLAAIEFCCQVCMQVFGVARICLCTGQHGALLLRVDNAGMLKLSVMHWHGVEAKKTCLLVKLCR